MPTDKRKRCAAAAVFLLTATCGLTSFGCATVQTVRVSQPFAPPSQQGLQLTPAPGAKNTVDGRRAVLVTFPLPGARSGPRAYALYLSIRDESRTQTIADGPSADARGFFVQEVGQLKGKSLCTGGEIRFGAADWIRPEARITLDIRCEDGTYVSGEVSLRDDEAALRAFERRYAGDITALRSVPASQPAEADAPLETTRPRRQSSEPAER